MSHNGYVQGLLENGCDVDILMAQDSWGKQDAGLPTWEKAHYYCYPSIAWQDKLRLKLRGTTPLASGSSAKPTDSPDKKNEGKAVSVKARMRAFAKTVFYTCFPSDPVYPLEAAWIKNAAKFSSSTKYDLVISNSSPAASHKLVGMLLKKRQLVCKRWIQIWEDPWFFDLYGGHSEAVRTEEHALLREASEVYYVSPLTLKYQKQNYPDCAYKMKHIPLPYFDFAKESKSETLAWSFGYFGDYYSQTRNLLPFYTALRETRYPGYIYGDSDLHLQPTKQIDVSGRVTLDKLDKVQAQTKVLVHLCNLRGGQIPGKIYHYSATEKPILFILDGTEDEKDILKAYFSQFDRFYFCENNAESILETINRMCAEDKKWKRLEAFAPDEVVSQLL